MKLTVSNIAWDAHEEEAAAALMREFGIPAVEVAPARVGPSAGEYRSRWEGWGYRISSLQALLFGRPDLLVFGGEAVRARTREYLLQVIRLGGELGANALVFGSPRNRLAGSLPRSQAEVIAAEFFGSLGEAAAAHGMALCLEPNPPAYGADFMTSTPEAAAFVARVGSPGFRLNLDLSTIALNGEDPVEMVRACLPVIGHVHVSEPHLGPVGSGGSPHESFARALRESGYDGWVSVEMRSAGGGGNLAAVRQALTFVVRTYGAEG